MVNRPIDLLLFYIKWNTLVANKFYSNETSNNIEEFSKESTSNQDRTYITSDLEKEYKIVIEKLGFKHQKCMIHNMKILINALKTIVVKMKFMKMEKKLINIHKQDIFDLFKSKTYDVAKKVLIRCYGLLMNILL
jgi:hypothetical protein